MNLFKSLKNLFRSGTESMTLEEVKASLQRSGEDFKEAMRLADETKAGWDRIAEKAKKDLQ